MALTNFCRFLSKDIFTLVKKIEEEEEEEEKKITFFADFRKIQFLAKNQTKDYL